MRLLLDTNIFLEVLLDRDNKEDACALLARGRKHDLFISDFSLHSVGVFLFRAGKHALFDDFVRDIVVAAFVRVATLPVDGMTPLTEAAFHYRLDFDDSYQYVVSRRWNLTLVSFDRDFERTPESATTPGEILSSE